MKVTGTWLTLLLVLVLLGTMWLPPQHIPLPACADAAAYTETRITVLLAAISKSMIFLTVVLCLPVEIERFRGVLPYYAVGVGTVAAMTYIVCAWTISRVSRTFVEEHDTSGAFLLCYFYIVACTLCLAIASVVAGAHRYGGLRTARYAERPANPAEIRGALLEEAVASHFSIADTSLEDI